MMSNSIRCLSMFLTITLLMTYYAYNDDIHAQNAPEQIEKTQSQFLEIVEDVRYPHLADPGDSVDLLWDFSLGRMYSFDYDQTLKSTLETSQVPRRRPIEQTITTSGQLVAEAQPARQARIVMQDMLTKMEIPMPNGEMNSTYQEKPSVVVNGMREDGTFSVVDTIQVLFYMTLFPLPGKSVRVGDSVSMTVRMPFNAMGSPLYIEGTSTVTLAGIVDRHGRICAQLNSELRLQDFKSPAEIEGKYSGSVVGMGKAFFDLDKRQFVESVSALLIRVNAALPVPKMRGSTPDLDVPAELSMKIMSDSLTYLSAK